MPPGPGGRLFDLSVSSRLGIASGPLLNSKWVEAYAHLGFDVLTYATVRTTARAAHPLPNIVPVKNYQQATIARSGGSTNGSRTLAISFGLPSMEPDVWRKDVRRAKDRLGRGQILIVSVVGTPRPDSDADALAQDYARCAAWAAEAGADVIEVHLACPDPDHGRMLYEDARTAAHVLGRVRAHVGRPLVAKLGAFRSPRQLHETLAKLGPWVHGFSLVHGIQRRVVDAEGRPLFEGKDRETPRVIGWDTYDACTLQVGEAVAWRKAGEWQRAILAVGGVTSIERAQRSLRDGADAVLVDTVALAEPLFAYRFRNALQTAA